ncbi:nucleotide exchange factor GrpE [Alkalibacterium sp. MB6]|uniref:nucleotide exchange factor GrpE n=1 Tax=Alkalibacterium sp. MB6 TaxID=2081965 RepID=UPI00137B3CCD|nr:nucleotide exchange factor GrpE [Alkalibacterium sp. MB6]
MKEKEEHNTNEEVEPTIQEEEVLEEMDSTNEEQSEETSEVNSDVATLQTELDELSDRYLRLQAEMANMRRRNQREKEDVVKYRSQSLAKELLPALDNLERALSIEVDTEAGKNLKKGIEMVYDSFLQAFASEGIEVINPVGEPFDPNIHEAYTQVPAEGDAKSNTVAQVFEKGYKLKDRVLRAAKVSVTL